MTSTRGNWLRCVLGGLAVLVVGAPTVRAQGPDPFKPYNWMYVPYTTAIGPAGPGAGQSAASMGRSALGGANQFDTYMMELQGAGRASREKYGIGMPYYRAAVDPLFDRDGRREYQPNRRTEATFEDTMDRVNQKYFAYFSEKDPKKRANLLRDYKLTQRTFSRSSLLNRRGGLREDLRGASELDTSPRARSDARLDDDRESPRDTLKSRTRSSEGAPGTSVRDRSGGASSRDRSIPPAPEIGSTTGRRAVRPGRTPSEVLDRSRRFDEKMPSSRRSIDGRSSDSRAIPAAPPLAD